MRAQPRKAFVAVLIVAALSGVPAFAQEWPTRPITLVVASTPGSMMDFISRSLAQDMSVTLGQPPRPRPTATPYCR